MTISTLPTTSSVRPSVRQLEIEDLHAEQRLLRRMVIVLAIVVPVGAAFFAALMYTAARMAAVSTGPPVAYWGAGIGVLAGIFFGMWAGVVASVHDIERTEARETCREVDLSAANGTLGGATWSRGGGANGSDRNGRAPTS